MSHLLWLFEQSVIEINDRCISLAVSELSIDRSIDVVKLLRVVAVRCCCVAEVGDRKETPAIEATTKQRLMKTKTLRRLNVSYSHM
jgi:hypothetical protein